MATRKNMMTDGNGRLVEVVDSTARELILNLKKKIENLTGGTTTSTTTTTYVTNDATESYDDTELRNLISQKADKTEIGSDITIDDTPTENSENAVSSGGVYSVVNPIGVLYDGVNYSRTSISDQKWTIVANVYLPSGTYMVFGHLLFAANSEGFRGVAVSVGDHGSSYTPDSDEQLIRVAPASGTQGTIVSVCTPIVISDDEEDTVMVGFYAYQYTGDSLGFSNCTLKALRIK